MTATTGPAADLAGPGPAPEQGLWERVRFPVLVFLAVAVVLVLDVWSSRALLDRASAYTVPFEDFPGAGALEGWYRYDGGWYLRIATEGYYSLGPAEQSPVAFFPAYPLLMRLVAVVVRDPVLAGILVTFACGLGFVVTFHRWVADRLGTSTARLAVAMLVLYPYAYYLFGAVYADALFLLATIGAFVLLEKGHPILAGLAGAVATAARPLGIAVVVGLVVLTVCRHGGLRRWRSLRPADAGVLLSLGGLVAFMAYQWATFGDPLLFDKVQAAPGWDQGTGPSTWLKRGFFGRLVHLPGYLQDVVSGTTAHHPTPFNESVYTVGTMLQAAFLLAVVVLIPRVVRRLGWGYGAYVVVLVVIPLLGTKDFQGVGRYVLGAFPAFAVGAELLGRRPALRWWWLGASGALLVLLTSAFARGYYIA